MTTQVGTPQLAPSVETLERTEPKTSFGDGDHERFAHYVRKDKIVESNVMGTPTIALCGKVWVPNRDPKRFPVCPQCKEIYESMRGGGAPGSGDGGSGGGDAPS